MWHKASSWTKMVADDGREIGRQMKEQNIKIKEIKVSPSQSKSKCYLIKVLHLITKITVSGCKKISSTVVTFMNI